jgi:hypothetical protein
VNEGDHLLQAIRGHVMALGVPIEQQEALTILVAQTVVTIMSDPRFFNHLVPVQRLQAENAALRQHLMLLQMPQRAPAPRKRPAKKAPVKKTVSKSPTVKVRGSTAANRRAFKQGFGG